MEITFTQVVRSFFSYTKASTNDIVVFNVLALVRVSKRARNCRQLVEMLRNEVMKLA